MTESSSSVSSLETTQNPFESDIEDRLHFPGFSPSMFTTPRTPQNEKNKPKEFRWSIGQISILNPADIDEFPNQETSSTIEREQEAQQAIDEYFSQDAIVPSPWTPNRSVKHVTFSPLPPHMQYIPNESSINSPNASQNRSSHTSSPTKMHVDVAVQTNFCIPLDFDLEEVLGQFLYNGNESEDNKDLSMSSLRRKLFPQGDNHKCGEKDVNNNEQKANFQKIRSILKQSKSPSVVTSSPVGRTSSAMSNARDTSSPDVSPIKTPPSNSPMRHSHFLESSGITIGDELDMFPDISPIKDFEKAPDHKTCGSIEQRMEFGNSECKEDMEGGPLEISALTVTDDTIDSDEDKPAKVTMEDLADDSSLFADDQGNEEKPAKVTMEDLAVDSSDDGCEDKKPAAITMEDLSMPGNIYGMKEDRESVGAEDTQDMETSELMASMEEMAGTEDMPKESTRLEPRNEESFHSREFLTSTSRYTEYGFQKVTNHIKTSIKHSTTHEQLDDDVLMVRAAAALRRANRFSSPNSIDNTNLNRVSNITRQVNSDLDASGLPWRPVSMSTPLNPPDRRPRVFGSSTLDCQYCPDTRTDVHLPTSFRHENRVPSKSSDNSQQRRVSPVMEDIMRRRELLSAGLREASSPSPTSLASAQYGKWRTPRTYPLSYMERKVLYGKPPNRALEYTEALTPRLYAESKRASWPPSRPYSPRLSYMSRPPSPPPAWSDPKRLYRIYPEGSVSKMPLPAPYRNINIDSGFEDWKKSISRWEQSVRNQASSLKYY